MILAQQTAYFAPGCKFSLESTDVLWTHSLKMKLEIYKNLNKCKKKMQENKTALQSSRIFGQKAILPVRIFGIIEKLLKEFQTLFSQDMGYNRDGIVFIQRRHF